MGRMEMIEKAKKYLKRKPIDAAHGLDHHEAVVQNCLEIVRAEHLWVDRPNLVIAAWWHDLESQEGVTELLQEEMVKHGFDKHTVDIVSEIVRSHTFGGKQETIEAKILYDADKMEYFNPQRISDALKNAKSGLLPISVLERHCHSWLERHQRILDSFHFGYSKKVAQDNLSATRNQIGKTRIFLGSIR